MPMRWQHILLPCHPPSPPLRPSFRPRLLRLEDRTAPGSFGFDPDFEDIEFDWLFEADPFEFDRFFEAGLFEGDFDEFAVFDFEEVAFEPVFDPFLFEAEPVFDPFGFEADIGEDAFEEFAFPSEFEGDPFGFEP